MAKVTNKNIAELQKVLLKWYDSNGRKFPWRKKRMSSYQIVIAEVLLQRTKAETVAGFYPTFIRKFPGWKEIAMADVKMIEHELKPIGLYRQRAGRLKNLAVEMVKRKGKFPEDRNELESIPFLGQYIVNAVELLVHKKNSPLIDVNMARIIERYFGQRKMADIRYDSYLQDVSWKLADNARSKELNWAVLDFAALICSARKPLCSTCTLKHKCLIINNIQNN